MTTKKLLSLFLTVTILFALLAPIASVSVFADYTSGYYRYTVSNGEATITKYNGSDTDVVIPDTLGGYPVTSIGSYAFRDCTSLSSVTIGNGVTSIGSYAFYYCIRLTSITIPDSVTSIGGYAFYDCHGLSSITIPDSVTSIGYYAFYNTAWYKNQSDGLVYAGKVAYEYKGTMPENTSITLRADTTEIVDRAFRNCTSLSSITIPDSVTSIGSDAFRNCTSLSSVTIGNGVTSIGSCAFLDCKNIRSIVIPNTVFYLGPDTFLGCINLTSISFPYCFAGTFGYLFGRYTYQSANSSGYRQFGAPTPQFDSSEYSNYYYFIPRSLKNVTITCCDIPDYAFINCSQISSITIGDGVRRIGDNAFSSCTGLTSISIPDSVTSIGQYAFNFCTSLNRVDITDIAAWCKIVFSDSSANPLCKAHNLYINNALATKVTIPDNVTRIGDYAFYSAASLEDVYIYGSPSFGSNVFTYYQDGYQPLSVTLYGYSDSSVKDYASRSGLTFESYDIVYGDVDHNSLIELRDLSTLIDWVYGFQMPSYGLQNADCNADEKIDFVDVSYLAKYLAGWDITLGTSKNADFVESETVFSVDFITVAEGENTISVPVRISGLTDSDNLGAVQLNIAYDTSKLRLTACYTAQDGTQYDADFFDTVSMMDPVQSNGSFSLIALTTQASNPNWASDYEFNDYPFVVLEFEVLGLWADTVPLTLTGTALRRSDDAPLQVAFTNGSVDPVHVSGVELDAQELSIKINESASLTASVSPANARLKTLTWTSSDPSVVTVSNGVVSAKMTGTATITVTTVDGSFSDACTITVYCEHESTTLVGYRDPTCSVDGYTGDTCCAICGEKLQVGDSIQKLPHTPALSWKNDNNEHWHACSVCGGKVDAVAHTLVEGPESRYLKSAATCTALAVYYKSCSVCGYKSSQTFTYGEMLPHPYQRVDAYTLKCSVCNHIERFGDLNGDSNYTGADVNALAQIAVGKGTDENGQADTNFDSVIDVSDVLLLAKKIAGWNVNLGENTAPAEPVANNITVSADQVQIDAGAQTVTVPIHLSGVTDTDDLGALQIELSYDATKLQLVSAYCTTGTGRNKVSYGADVIGNFTTSGAGAEPYRILTWNTSAANLNLDSVKQINSKEYAFVTFNVLGIWGGNTPVSVSATAIRRSDGATLAISAENGSVSREELTNAIRVTGVSLDQENANLEFGNTLTLLPTITPENATYKGVSWTSSNPDIATVEDGVVTALSVGETIITATTVDGGFTDTCTITVYCNHTGETHTVNAIAATCTADGYTGDTVCDDCGATIATGSPITKLGHDYKGVVTNPTCTENGYTTYTCSRCGDSYVADYTNALGHTGGTATCSNKAVCKRCHEEYGELDPNNHEDCTDKPWEYDGEQHWKVCDCGESLFTAEHTTSEDYCFDEHEHWKVCAVCGAEIAGSREKHSGGTCKVCGKKAITISVADVIADPNANSVTVPIRVTGVADEDDVGALRVDIGYDTTKLRVTRYYDTTGSGKNRVCYGAASFGSSQTSPISPVTNPFKILVWDTSEENLNLDTECEINDQEFCFLEFEILDGWTGTTPLTVSGQALRRSDNARLDVVFEDGSVSLGIIGDVDGSGVIDIGDVMTLAKFIAGWNLGDSYHAKNADCDGSGIIDIGDVMQLAKFIAGWNVVLG